MIDAHFWIEAVCRRFAPIKAHALASTSGPAIDRALPKVDHTSIMIGSALALGMFNAAAEMFSQRAAAASRARVEGKAA